MNRQKIFHMPFLHLLPNSDKVKYFNTCHHHCGNTGRETSTHCPGLQRTTDMTVWSPGGQPNCPVLYLPLLFQGMWKPRCCWNFQEQLLVGHPCWHSCCWSFHTWVLLFPFCMAGCYRWTMSPARWPLGRLPPVYFCNVDWLKIQTSALEQNPEFNWIWPS